MTEVFYSFLITSFIGCVLSIVAVCYRSKCREIGVCGCIKITRDVEIELEEDMREPQAKTEE